MRANEFRLDFFIAIAALLVSAASAIALIYQTRTIGEQFSATIWPYLSIEATYNPDSVKLDLHNDGLGPALIESAQLFVDGKPVPGWANYFITLVKRDAGIRHAMQQSRAAYLAHRHIPFYISAASVGSSTTIAPGNTMQLLYVELPANIPVQRLSEAAMKLRFCYCSLNDRCWTLDAVPGRDDTSRPVSVARCTESASIGAGFRPQ